MVVANAKVSESESGGNREVERQKVCENALVCNSVRMQWAMATGLVVQFNKSHLARTVNYITSGIDVRVKRG